MTSEEDSTNEDRTPSEDAAEKDSSILASSTVAEDNMPAGFHGITPYAYKKLPSSKNEPRKASASAKKTEANGFRFHQRRKNDAYCALKVDRSRSDSLINRGASEEESGEDAHPRLVYPNCQYGVRSVGNDETNSAPTTEAESSNKPEA